MIESKPLYKVDFSYVQDSYVIVEATDEDNARDIIDRNRAPDVEFTITGIEQIPEEDAQQYREAYTEKIAPKDRTLN